MLLMLEGERNQGGDPVPLYAVPSMLQVSYPMGTAIDAESRFEFHIKYICAENVSDWLAQVLTSCVDGASDAVVPL